MNRPEMTYSQYLCLDQVLSAQAPQSNAHDEFLFIIQHQTSELWMRLAVHELEAARSAVAHQDLSPAFKMLTRVARIFEQLNNAWDVLRTMTPSEYTAFREDLGGSSGFQSWQYRQIEFMLGNRQKAALSRHGADRHITEMLEKELLGPSLYDVALAHLCKQGVGLDPEDLRQDFSSAYRANVAVQAAWERVYRDPQGHWDTYQLAEKLVDLEDYFRRWRFNHATTVERIIGLKRGTGGTGGVSYLKSMLEVELFPELWHVRTAL